jgi:hypothetical protein
MDFGLLIGVARKLPVAGVAAAALGDSDILPGVGHIVYSFHSTIDHIVE